MVFIIVERNKPGGRSSVYELECAPDRKPRDSCDVPQIAEIMNDDSAHVRVRSYVAEPGNHFRRSTGYPGTTVRPASDKLLN